MDWILVKLLDLSELPAGLHLGLHHIGGPHPGESGPPNFHL